MTRTVRGAWTRRRQLAPVAALAAALVAVGTVVLVQARDAGDPALVAPLVVIGCVALAGPARAAARERRDEVALARLRGRGGTRLVLHLLAEPLLALVAGGLVGLVVGSAVVGATPVALLVLVAMLAYASLVTAVVFAGAVREPLSAQVSRQSRPRAASVVATFAGILALAAGGYAVFAAAQQPPGPRWLVDAAPALVGLAVGQLLVWGLGAAGRIAVARSSSAPAAAFLAVRRLARRAGTVAPLGLLTAAAVTATVAGTADASARAWVDQAARLRAAAPVQFRLDRTAAAQAVALTHRLDPRGRWLEAAVVLPRDDEGQRTVLLDTSRYARVSAPVLAPTAAGDVAGRATALAGRGRAVASGGTAVLTGRVVGAVPAAVRVHFEYVTDQNYVGTRTLTAAPGPHGDLSARTVLPGCAHGCVPTGLAIDGVRGGSGDRPRATLALRSLELAGVDLRAAFGLPAELPLPGPTSGDTSLRRPSGASAPVPVLTAGGPARQVRGPDGTGRSARPLGTVGALPLVGRHGVLGDLDRALTGSLPTSPSARVLVLARADTPPAVLAGLPGHRIDLSGLRTQVDDASHAARARTALLAGLGSVLVAVIALLAGLGRQRRELALELAALRVVGMPLARLRGSVRGEVLACGLATGVASALGAWLAGELLLSRLALLVVPDDAVPPDSGARPVLLVAAGLVTLLLVLVVAGRARAVREPASRPMVLREEAGA